MPELLVDFITSLDGYAAADGWPGFWGHEGTEYLAWLEQEPEPDHTVLIGANTYRVMAAHASAGEPGTKALTGRSKVVFSTTVREPLVWANTQLVSDDAVEVVRTMKAQGPDSMRTLGSPAALETGELRLPQDGPFSWTAHADLAEVDAIALTRSGVLDGVSPALTGSEMLDFAEIAGILSDLTGREIRRIVVDDEEWKASAIERRVPPPPVAPRNGG